MRTTINLPDALLDRAKREAKKEGVTLGAFIERSLRASLLRPPRQAEPAPFRLVTFGRGGLLPGLTFDRLKEVIAEEDIERASSGLSSRAADADDAAPRR